MRFAVALALAFALAPLTTIAAPRRPLSDPVERTPGPVRYLVVATVLQLTACQPGKQVPCYDALLVDFVRDTETEARDLARQIAIEGCWRQDQTGETVGEYFPAHRMQGVRVSLVMM